MLPIPKAKGGRVLLISRRQLLHAISASTAGTLRSNIECILRDFALGSIQPVVTEKFRLEEVVLAISRVTGRGSIGKIIINIA